LVRWAHPQQGECSWRNKPRQFAVRNHVSTGVSTIQPVINIPRTMSRRRTSRISGDTCARQPPPAKKGRNGNIEGNSVHGKVAQVGADRTSGGGNNAEGGGTVCLFASKGCHPGNRVGKRVLRVRRATCGGVSGGGREQAGAVEPQEGGTPLPRTRDEQPLRCRRTNANETRTSRAVRGAHACGAQATLRQVCSVSVSQTVEKQRGEGGHCPPARWWCVVTQW